MTAERHASVLAGLRNELDGLRADRGISEKFADWHHRLMACLKAIVVEFPDCVSLCEELQAINYELRPEIEDVLPESLPKDLIMTQNYRMYFRKQCDRAAEAINALLYALRAA
jgi:hypothetical protein